MKLLSLLNILVNCSLLEWMKNRKFISTNMDIKNDYNTGNNNENVAVGGRWILNNSISILGNIFF